MFKVATEKQSVGEIISSAFDLVKELFILILPVVAGFQLISAVVTTLTRPAVIGNMDAMIDSAFANKSPIPSMILFLLNVVVYAFILFAAKEVAAGNKPNLLKHIKQSIDKLIPLMIAGAIVGVLTYFGYFLFVIPAAIVYILFFLYTPAIVIDDQDGLSALKTSMRYVFSAFLHVLGVLASVFILYVVIRWLATGLGFILPGFASAVIFWLVATAYGIFFPCLEFVLYNDLKLRQSNNHKATSESF